MQRRQWWWCFGLFAGVWVAAVPLSAQERNDLGGPPLSVGIVAGGEVSAISRGGDLQVSFTVPRGDRRALELFVGGYRGSNGFDIGVYGFQVRRPIARGRRPGVEPFFTLGVMGWVDRFESSSCRDGVCQADRSLHVIPPVVGLLGAGVQYTITPRLAVRVESQAAMALIIPVGLRIAAGVSIPLGGGTFTRRSR